MFHSKLARSSRSLGSFAKSRRARKGQLAIPAIVERLEDRTLLSTSYAFNAASGDWNTATNWNPNGVPGTLTTDTASIASFEGMSGQVNPAVTHSTSVVDQIAGLTMGGSATLGIGAGTIATPGLSFNNGGTINVNGGELALQGTTVGGTGGAINDQAGGVIRATGNVSLGSGGATYSMAGGELDVVANPTASASFALSGSLSNTGTINLEQAATTNTATLIVPSGASLTNTGLIETIGVGTISTSDFALDNLGTIDPGGNGAVGTLSVTGFAIFGDPIGASASTLNIDLGGTATGASDLVSSSNTTILNGTLNLSLLSNYTPAVGDSITILSSSGTVSGTFSAVNPPSNLPAGVGAKVVYGANSVSVQFYSTTDTFTNFDNNSLWDDANNWTLGLPTSSTQAILDSSNLVHALTNNTILVNPGANNTDAVGGLTDNSIGLTIQTGTLALGGAGTSSLYNSTVTGPGTLHVVSGGTTLIYDTINAPLTNDGTIVVEGNTTTVNGTFQNNADGTIDENITNQYGSVGLNVSALTNAGTINLQQPAATATTGYTAYLRINTSSANPNPNFLTNTGTINVTAGSNSGVGQIDINGDTLTNNGTIAITKTTTTVNLQNGTFTDAGLITIDTSSSLTINGGGTFNYNNGASFSGGGPLTIISVVVNLNAGLTDSGLGSLTIYDSVVNKPGTLTNVTGVTTTLNSDTINAPLTNDGLIVVEGNGTTVTGAFSNHADGTIDENITTQSGSVGLSVSALTNAGTINLQQPAATGTNVYTAYLILNTSTNFLTNTGTINVTAGSNGGVGEIDLNDGTLTNNGTIAITKTTTNVYLQNGTFTDAGPITIDTSSSLTINGAGTLNYNTGASFSGGGPLAINSVGAVNLNIGLTDSGVGSLTIASSTVNGPGTLTNVTGVTTTLLFDTINAPLTNDGLIVVEGNGTTVNGTFQNNTDGTIDENITTQYGSAILNVSALTNAGTINLQQPAATVTTGYTAYLSSNSSGNFLTNTGTINVTAGNNGGLGEIDLGGGTLTNNGTIAITKTTTNVYLQNGTFTNNDGLTVDGSSTTIQGGGTFTNNGTATIDSASTLDITSATFTNFNGTTNTLTGGIYHVIGTFQFDNALISNNAANIVLDGASAKIIDQNNNDALMSFANNTSSGSFTIENGANYTAPGAFTNNGAIAIGATDTFTAITNYTQNSGTTTIDGGTLAATNFVIAAQLLVATEIDIAGGELGGTGNLNAQVTLNNGTFDVGGVGAAGTLNLAGNYQQGSAGVLNVVIGGTASGDYSVLNATGSASLGGTLNVREINGFVPAPGDNFPVLVSSGVSGNFATENGLNLGNGVSFVPVFSPTGAPTEFILETSDVANQTPSFNIQRGAFRFNFATRGFAQIVTLTNTSTQTITEPVSLVLDGLTSGVTLMNSNGTTSATSPSGSPYINLPSGNIAPNQSVQVLLQFADPSYVSIAYTTRVLVGVGPR